LSLFAAARNVDRSGYHGAHADLGRCERDNGRVCRHCGITVPIGIGTMTRPAIVGSIEQAIGSAREHRRTIVPALDDVERAAGE